MIEETANTNETYTTQEENNYQPQQQEYPSYTVLDLIGKEFEGTKAANFDRLEDLAKGYNNLVSLMGSRIDKLTPQQKEIFRQELGGSISSVPQDAAEYQITSKYDSIGEDYHNILCQAAQNIGLSQEQAPGFAELIDGFVDGYQQSLENQAEEVKQGYIEESRNYFGGNLDMVLDSATYATEKVIPYVTGMEAGAFLDLIERHGLAGHPAMLSLLAELGELYQSGRSQVPNGSYTNGGMSRQSYSSHEAMKILANPQHPQYKEYFNGLCSACGYKK